MRGRMTAAMVKAISRPGLYGDGETLYLRVAPGGSKSWIQHLTIKGRRRDLGLGGYPLVTLAEAREAAATRLPRSAATPCRRSPRPRKRRSMRTASAGGVPSPSATGVITLLTFSPGARLRVRIKQAGLPYFGSTQSIPLCSWKTLGTCACSDAIA